MPSKIFCCSVLLLTLGMRAWAVESPEIVKAKEKIKARAEAIQEQLQKERVTREFKDSTLEEAVRWLKEKFNLEIVLDPTLDVEGRRVPVEVVKNVSLRTALTLICGADLQSSVFGEAVFITTAENMSKIREREFVAPEKPTEAQKKLILSLYQFRTSADFDKKPVAQAIAFLGEKANLKIKIESPEAVKDMTVSMSVKDSSLKSLLDLVCGSRLGWEVGEDSILIAPINRLIERDAERERKKKAEEKGKKDQDTEKEGKTDAGKEQKGKKSKEDKGKEAKNTEKNSKNNAGKTDKKDTEKNTTR